ncbi:hypothetical protein [Pseudomonas quasicaspiana]|uniref:hypothetical protein n=1 Tax=Pseudomonas quasicaspiana TaxID=2829821 RepID=UPI001E4C219A|nr:hypothetical protein [Pseudomonas quasicaspiana]MCD5972555.1 hypothetical protein [Pseudomonas quasicaspiana]
MTNTLSFTATIHGTLSFDGIVPAPYHSSQYCSIDLAPCNLMSAATTAAEEAIAASAFNHPVHASGFSPEHVTVRSQCGSLCFAADINGTVVHWVHDDDDLLIWEHKFLSELPDQDQDDDQDKYSTN